VSSKEKKERTIFIVILLYTIRWRKESAFTWYVTQFKRAGDGRKTFHMNTAYYGPIEDR